MMGELKVGDGLKVGEIVELNSGGPEMTIKEVDSAADGCVCQWFSGTKRSWGKLMEAVFKRATLRSVTRSMALVELLKSMDPETLKYVVEHGELPEHIEKDRQTPDAKSKPGKNK